MSDEKKIFSDVELGIRELFRIIVPGAYGVILILLFAPQSSAATFVGRSLGFGVSSSFFLGLFGYALRPHERWAPYFLHFEKYRVQLNEEITRILTTAPVVREVENVLPPARNVHESRDHVALYKLFLESKAADLRDRVHYFSSFYYMLIELSLFSWLVAFWITAGGTCSTSQDCRGVAPRS